MEFLEPRRPNDLSSGDLRAPAGSLAERAAVGGRPQCGADRSMRGAGAYFPCAVAVAIASRRHFRLYEARATAPSRNRRCHRTPRTAARMAAVAPWAVGRNKPPGPAFGRPDDKLRALRRSHAKADDVSTDLGGAVSEVKRRNAPSLSAGRPKAGPGGLLRPTGSTRATAASRKRPQAQRRNSEQSGATTQPSGAVAISEPDVAAAGRGVRAIMDLIVGAAVVGTNEMAIIIAAMVLMPARQQRHRGQTVGELLNGWRVLPPGPPVSCCTCRRHGAEQRRHPNQRLHPAISIGGVMVPDSMAQLAENLKSHSGSAR